MSSVPRQPPGTLRSYPPSRRSAAFRVLLLLGRRKEFTAGKTYLPYPASACSSRKMTIAWRDSGTRCNGSSRRLCAATRPVAFARFELAQRVEEFGRGNVADQLSRSGPRTVPAGLDLRKALTKAAARNRFASNSKFMSGRSICPRSAQTDLLGRHSQPKVS